MIDEVAALLRGLVQRGVVHRVDDGGSVQRADIETAEGALRAEAQVMQMPGLACNPGTAGVMAVVLAPGGDQGVPLVMITATGAGLAGLAPGEAVLYALDNSARIHVKPGGMITVRAGTRIEVAASEVTVTATTKVTVTAPAIDLVGVVDVKNTLKVGGVTLEVP